MSPQPLVETVKTIDQLKSSKAAGVDGIPPEIWKHEGPTMQGKLHELLVCCREQGKLPQDLSDAVIVTLYKNKGEKSDGGNYRGITLLSIAYKVLARLLLNRLVHPSPKNTSQKVTVASELTEAQRTWCLSSVNCKRSAVSKTWGPQAHIKTHERLIRDLLFADDAAVVVHTERALQCITSCFANAAQLFGLEVSLKKMEVLYQLAPREVYHPPHITIGETELKSVQQFSYLGCTISSDARTDKEVDNRLAKASSAFGRLYKRVWNNKILKIQTKISVYRTVVLTTLLYGFEAGSHTTVMSYSLNVSTSAAFTLFLTFTGANSSRMSRSLNRLKFPTLKPCY